MLIKYSHTEALNRNVRLFSLDVHRMNTNSFLLIYLIHSLISFFVKLLLGTLDSLVDIMIMQVNEYSFWSLFYFIQFNKPS